MNEVGAVLLASPSHRPQLVGESAVRVVLDFDPEEARLLIASWKQNDPRERGSFGTYVHRLVVEAAAQRVAVRG